MRRRDALRAGAGVLGAAILGRGAERATAHPGPYRPYGSVDVPGAREVIVDDDSETAYLATTTGYATADVSSYDRPELLADRREPLADREGGPLRMIFDVKVEGNTLLVVGPANALGDPVSGMLVVDVSDPADPRLVAFHETDYPIHNCFLLDGYAYLTANDGGSNPLAIVDLGDGDPEEVARWSIVDRERAWAEVSPAVRPLHDVWVQDDRAYLVYWDAGTWILDVSDPADPTYVADFGGRPPEDLSGLSSEEATTAAVAPPGNDHYVTLNENGTLLGVGKEAWARRVDGELVGGPAGIELWDVAEETEPERLATIEPPPSPDPTMEGVWTTSHNFELRGGKLYSSWYEGGVKIHDVSEPTDPTEIAWWRSEDTGFWTARVAVPDEAFVATSVGYEREGIEGRLYVFPDHAGEQPDRPPLGEGNPDADTPTPTPTETPSGSPTDAPGTDGGAPAKTDDGNGTAATSDDGSSDTVAPGFGLGTAGGALGVGAWWLLRRTRRAGRADD